MNASEIRARLKPWMLPIAMTLGAIFHNYMGYLAWMAPWLIFAMLLLTFCKINPHEVRLTKLTAMLLPMQVLGGVAIYLALRPLSVSLAEGIFICVFCPTATAAPVIVGMLGGSVPRLATFSVMSNIACAATAPLLFTLMGSDGVEFLPTFLTISAKVIPLIISPLLVALLLMKAAPKVHRQLSAHAGLAFYLWAVSLIVCVGQAVSFVMKEPPSAIPLMIALALGAGAACLLQFIAGRRVGERVGDRVAATQALMQKNTVLSIWMATTFLHPICSVAPAAYIAWQNTLNSIQLYKHQRHAATAKGDGAGSRDTSGRRAESAQANP